MKSIDKSLDIISLIENNPIIKIPSIYNSKLLLKIKEYYKKNYQILFITSYYCLNNNQYNNYIINLNDIWKLIGFETRNNAKIFLFNHFVLNSDYIIKNKLLCYFDKETILLNINTFKLLCTKSKTSNGQQLLEYYIQLEDILYTVISKEINYYKKNLDINNNKILNNKK